MVASDYLFELIKSLTKNEKGYFKKYVQLYKGNNTTNYIQLFDAIEQQKAYDEKALMQKFRDKVFAKRFAATKSYLYELLLKSLRSYYSEINVEVQIAAMIHNIFILYKKSMYGAAEKLIKRTEKLALKYELHYDLLKIYEWKSKILVKKQNIKQLKEGAPDIIDATKRMICNIEELAQAKALTLNSALTNIKSTISKSSQIEYEMKAIWENSKLKSTASINTFMAKYVFLTVASNYQISMGNVEKAYKLDKENLELFDANVHFKEEHTRSYITVLNNVLTSVYYLHDDKLLTVYLDRLKKVPQEIKGNLLEDIEFEVFQRYSSVELKHLVDSGLFDNKSQKIVAQIEDNLERYESMIITSLKMTLQYNIAYFYFGLGSFERALDYVNKILNSSESKNRQDIHTLARILNLMLHYELEHYELLEYAIKTAKYYIKAKSNLFQFEKNALKLFKDLNKDNSKTHMLSVLNQYIDNNKSVRDQLEIFKSLDIRSWAIAKVENKTLGEAVQKNL